MDIFDIIPSEILNHIMLYLDYKSVISMYNASRKFAHMDLHNLLRYCLYKITKFNTINYTTQGLIKLCKIIKTSNIINAGTKHSLILTINGHVYDFEYNDLIQISSAIQVSMGYGYSLILTSGNEIYEFEHDDNTLKLINTRELNDTINIIQVSAGFNHGLLLTANGEVYAYGQNNYGELGLISNSNDKIDPGLIIGLPVIVQISAGYHHSLVLTDDGKVYGFGFNKFGQLGLGDNDNRSSPVLNHVLNNIIQICAGFNHSLALMNNGQVYGFGNNKHGQVSSGNVEFSNEPLLLCHFNGEKLSNIVELSNGFHHSLFLTNDGNVYAVGYNKYGQLGLCDSIDRKIVALVDNIPGIVQISAGSYHSLLLTDNGYIQAFGTIEKY